MYERGFDGLPPRPRYKGWDCFWCAIGSYGVNKKCIDALSHVVSKTYMMRVERENTRPRHILARLKRKRPCYSKSEGNAEVAGKIGAALFSPPRVAELRETVPCSCNAENQF
ncbi:IS1 family transposase [Rubidibacter lacunae]|uniref:IS1 family transposase n=1 Tax=Rubidibacter lacunae TaxID=582514 RepID=UPI0008FF02D2